MVSARKFFVTIFLLMVTAGFIASCVQTGVRTPTAAKVADAPLVLIGNIPGAYLNKDKNKSISLKIEGNCDERGSNEYNLALGERRARAVYDYLVNLGTAKKRLDVVSFGEEKPADMGHDEAAWAKNRRATFQKR